MKKQRVCTIYELSDGYYRVEYADGSHSNPLSAEQVVLAIEGALELSLDGVEG